ncbi:hypothetical protein TNCV_4002171 [Trichonephila clavipes]|uniref:Uncharacterized protein n=1 Tax=Trichonephila clavipes TaxID=2585209 RepID=A0A8X6V8K7_TRICX|nr:hypothetical protein TNCV_4002171 [Trichonephila clavipes]
MENDVKRPLPAILSHANGAGARHRSPIYHPDRADWDKFTRQEVITDALIHGREVEDAVFDATDAIMKAANAANPKTSNSHWKLFKPRWNSACHQAQKEQRRTSGNEQADIVARSATTELSITVPLCDMNRVIQHRMDNAWQNHGICRLITNCIA